MPIPSSPHPPSASPLFPVILYFLFFFPTLPRTKKLHWIRGKAPFFLISQDPSTVLAAKSCMHEASPGGKAGGTLKEAPPTPAPLRESSGVVGTPVPTFTPHCEDRHSPLLSSWRARRNAGHLGVGGGQLPASKGDGETAGAVGGPAGERWFSGFKESKCPSRWKLKPRQACE